LELIVPRLKCVWTLDCVHHIQKYGAFGIIITTSLGTRSLKPVCKFWSEAEKH
jgi:hypothetical protein